MYFLNRTNQERQGMEKKTIQKIEKEVKDLPTLPAVASKIFEVTNDPESSVDDLKSIIATDQVVAGRILRAVNSAYYGYPRQINTLSQAIVILGFNNVRSLALSVSIMEIFSGEKGGFDFRQLWTHAVGTAFNGRALARVFNAKSAEQFFVAGLLHDIGLVAMNKCFPDKFAACLGEACRNGKPLYKCEREAFGFNHADVGHVMANNWLLPQSLTDTITYHHEPRNAVDNTDMVYAIHVSDIICKVHDFGDYGDNEPFGFDSIYHKAAEKYRIGPEGPEEEILQELEADMEEASGFINIFS